MNKRTSGFFAITVASCLFVPLASIIYNGLINTPEQALQRFFNDDGYRGEDSLMDELILAGDKVVPLVLREIKNPNMINRRYAIAFLGNGAYREALPTLEIILKNEREKDYFRADALEAIFQIDKQRAMVLADTYQHEKNFLGQQARAILRGQSVFFNRSYEDAVARRHY